MTEVLIKPIYPMDIPQRPLKMGKVHVVDVATKREVPLTDLIGTSNRGTDMPRVYQYGTVYAVGRDAREMRNVVVQLLTKHGYTVRAERR